MLLEWIDDDATLVSSTKTLLRVVWVLILRAGSFGFALRPTLHRVNEAFDDEVREGIARHDNVMPLLRRFIHGATL